MATLVFSALGTLIGGPLGGALGALAGRQVDTMIFGGGNREGPRLKELSPTASSYGTPLPRHFGRMRVPGSVIWATELVEHQQTEGGGKGRPSVTTYSYTASFAVALASRPIISVGRIWADGNLLRGAAGDLKANGIFRLHTGEGDQATDPLIEQIEGALSCPAFRGLAYAVFENLDLGDFFNRIPALTFEVIADDGPFTVQSILDDVVAEADAALPLPGIDGYSCEGPLAETLVLLDPLFPMDCDAGGEMITISRERLQTAAPVLPEAAISVDDGDFGARSGFVRKREPALVLPPEILRYYDIGRDYQPGLQRAIGRTQPGQPRTVEIPAAMTSTNARKLADKMAGRAGWARESIAWRTTELDPAVSPGAVVSLPGQTGRWRVSEWEWRDTGVELRLTRMSPASAEAGNFPADAGRTSAPADLAAAATVITAFELPWDGTGSGDAPATYAAVSSAGPSWSGAALFVDSGDGSLEPLATSGRSSSTVGTMVDALPPANPLMIDRSSATTVELIGGDMALADATVRQLALGANRALIGEEIVQFGRATPLGNRRWRLEHWLRGRGGTETALDSHTVGESFVLLDGSPISLNPAQVATGLGVEIAAVGRGDSLPVTSPVRLQGTTRRPLSPVHPRAALGEDGSLNLSWTRRARGAWEWLDGVDAPLHEQAEEYLVTYGPLAAPVAIWQVGQPNLSVPAPILAELGVSTPGEAFRVRQRGSYAMSAPLFLANLP